LDPDRGGPLDPHVGSCIGAAREKARELGLVRSEVTRRRGHESRHLRPQESTKKLFHLVNRKVASGQDVIARK
jgi:hypothetical protein